MLTPNMQGRQIVDAAFRQAGVRPRIAVETDSIFALYAQVRFSDVCAVVPHSLLSLVELRQELAIAALARSCRARSAWCCGASNPIPPRPPPLYLDWRWACHCRRASMP